ncbi:uncharacterized protein TNCV_2635371 [Trichonephila clavipes]|nr:uncharacterized protein TNCV_2635371 [Trichonephila clavipes]
MKWAELRWPIRLQQEPRSESAGKNIRSYQSAEFRGPGGMAYSDFEKAEAFKDTLEVTFQENVEPYCDDKIEEVENAVSSTSLYFDNFENALLRQLHHTHTSSHFP